MRLVSHIVMCYDYVCSFCTRMDCMHMYQVQRAHVSDCKKVNTRVLDRLAVEINLRAGSTVVNRKRKVGQWGFPDMRQAIIDAWPLGEESISLPATLYQG